MVRLDCGRVERDVDNLYVVPALLLQDPLKTRNNIRLVGHALVVTDPHVYQVGLWSYAHVGSIRVGAVAADDAGDEGAVPIFVGSPVAAIIEVDVGDDPLLQ